MESDPNLKIQNQPGILHYTKSVISNSVESINGLIHKNSRRAASAASIGALITGPGGALAQERAEIGESGTIQSTQVIDGKEYERYPGDPGARLQERMHFERCWNDTGHISYKVSRVTPNKTNPSKRAVLSVSRLPLGICEDYVDRRISNVELRTQLPGQSTWKTSRMQLKAVETDTGQTNYKIGPIDWGQNLPEGKKMKVRVRATTELINTTDGMEDIPLGQTSTKTRSIPSVGKIFRVKR